MKKLLHIIATPRDKDSRTLKVSQVFIDGLKNRYPNSEIDTLDLYKEGLPELTAKN
ncbi:MAG: NAD(P)H-dependent oxidoreductase, partial [Candidatus Omnitrophica bacterium]|nr:NAD(P)H-dependent oxidoreductase [Candidatus Omnitrophota bacterium]